MSLLSLNGEWKYFLDPENNFSIEERIDPSKYSKSNIMSLPINWEKANLHNYSGVIWFIKTFKVSEKIKQERISILKFYGIDYFADVWLNGKYIGKHEGYFQSFDFDVTDKLNFGMTNNLVVKVNSPKEEPGSAWPLRKQLIKGIFNHHDCRPGSWSNEYGQDQNTGGIWNGVELNVNEKIFIRNTKITSILSEDYKTARVHVNINYSTKIFNPKETSFKISVFSFKNKEIEFNDNVSIQPGTSELNFLIELKNPLLWWSWDLGKPHIYSLKLNIKGYNSYSEEFAIRKVEIDKNDRFFLNGKELFLRGTNLIPTQFLSELNNIRIKKIVTLIRDANINAVRVHAHVNRKELYKEMDCVGIIIWQDFSLQWTYDNSDKFAQNAVDQIKDMVNLLYNHPSICFWCCHNEPGEQINTLDNLLRDAVLSQDQSRIIRIASNYEEHPYEGWYWGDKEHFSSTPMGPLVTEFGAQALPQKKSLKKFIPEDKLFPPDLDHWKYHNFQPDTTFNIAKVSIGKNINEFVENSQNYQSDLLKTAIHYYRRKKNKGTTGIFQFMFIDCWPSITWSVVDYYFVKKIAYKTLKECFSPVLLSVNLRQDQYFVGSKLNFDFTIVNDSYKKISNADVYINLNSRTIGLIKNIDIIENSTLFRHFESMEINLPNSLSQGEYNLEFVLKKKLKIISMNKFNIKIKYYENYEKIHL